MTPENTQDTGNKPTQADNHLWDNTLIRQYDLAGPRYTSYPTALQFSDHFTQDDWALAVEKSLTTTQGLSLYIHIPFCDTVCYYCACNKIITANHAHAERYLRYLKREIALRAKHLGREAQVKQIHLGGGTPTYFSDDQLSELMACLHQHFNIAAADALECAIEIHPQTVNPARLHHLHALGFNRISLGIQDFNEAVQHAVNRFNTKTEVQDIMSTLNALDFDSCSLDLIYGLPMQSAASFAETLQDVLDLNPDRISLFNYAHMPQLFKTQKQINTRELPEPQEKLHILHDSILTLQAHGYTYIGMDHFAKEHDELAIAQREHKLRRNFQGYSTHKDADIHGFGVSSISSFQQYYSQNAKQLDAYYAAIDSEKLPIIKGYTLNQDDELRREIINTLMCNFELDIEKIEHDFDIDFFDYFRERIEQLEYQQQDGLISFNTKALRVHTKGRLLVRSVCQLFDHYFQENDQSQTRYSRII